MNHTKVGTPEFFTDPDRLVSAALKAVTDCNLATFDLFDTLLVRRIADPDWIKDGVARYIAARAAECGIDCSWQTALRKRADAERRQRVENGRRHPDYEAVYPEFMAAALKEIFGAASPPDLLADVTDFELRLESAVLAPRTALVGLLRQLRMRGLRIWVMTDIYLPSSHIRVLLERAGIMPHLDGLMSSADTCHAKASGAAFEDLRTHLQADPSRWLHIGDNPFSDGHRPAAMGIRAMVLQDTGEAHRKHVFNTYAATSVKRPFWRGRLWQQMAMPLEGENRSDSPLYQDGYNFFGPLATAFVKHVAEQAQARGLRRIYFFSREGHMFLRIWEKAAKFWFPTENAPDVRYLCVSRLALAPATCARKGLTPVNAPMALLPPRNRDLRDICRVFGLDPNPLTTVFRKHNLESDTPLNPTYDGWTNAGWDNFERLLHDEEFQEAVRRQTAERGRLLERYLEQEGFFEYPEVAVVDIGWLGTIQRFLFDAIAHRPDCPRLHGFLLAATHGIPYPTTPLNDIEGFIFDCRQHNGAGGFITNSLNIFEEACREPAPGITGYEETDGHITPVRMDANHPARRGELEQDAYYAPLQAGMLDFAARAAPALAITGHNANDLLPWLKHVLTIRMAFPRAAEVQRLRWRHHLDEYDGHHKPPWRIRLRLTGLWDLPPGILRWLPGIRSAFFLWHTVVWRGLVLFRKLKTHWHVRKAERAAE
ncbi:MAG: HAD family hydrolase [Kiritimatiellia bacterium]|jgi:FMN phosphatase YigB (HAD superfamily)